MHLPLQSRLKAFGGSIDLGGCWLPEVNKQNMDGQGLYLSIFISYREFLGDESSKQVASLLNDKDSECVKFF